jgi:cation:H+ antiporter
VSSLSTLPLLGLFAGCAGVIWVAGVALSKSTDALDTRLGLGSALGGLILLAFATNLPEVAITVTAAIKGNLDLAVGNLLGGIAIQTLVLAALDAAGKGPRSLTFLASSLVLALEGVMVVAISVTALMTTQLPVKTNVAGVSPGTVLIVALWVGSLLVINRARTSLRWKIEAPESDPGRTRHQKASGADPQPHKNRSTVVVAGIFGLAALATLVAGYAIEESGNQLASKAGLTGAVFGATILAAATSLPELSTGLAAIKLGDRQLAISDIFGGNAFLPVLFILADLIGGRPALASAKPTDLLMIGLGTLLTATYVAGLILRPTRRFARLGPDSIAVIVIYALGILGLIAIGG